MARSNEQRRWQRSESRLEKQMQELASKRKALLANADKVRDLDAKRQLWKSAQALEDRFNKLQAKLRRLRAHAQEQQQPSLFEA